MSISVVALSYLAEVPIEVVSQWMDTPSSVLDDIDMKLHEAKNSPVCNPAGFNFILDPASLGVLGMLGVIIGSHTYIDFEMFPKGFIAQNINTIPHIELKGVVFAHFCNVYLQLTSEEFDPRKIERIQDGKIYYFGGHGKSNQKGITAVLRACLNPALPNRALDDSTKYLVSHINAILGTYKDLHVEQPTDERKKPQRIEDFTSDMLHAIKNYHRIRLDNCEHIQLEVGSVSHEGLIINLAKSIGTAFREKNNNVLYTATGFTQRLVSKKELKVNGLSAVLPSEDGYKGNHNTLVHWLFPTYRSAMEEARETTPGLTSDEEVECTEEACLQYLYSLYNKSASADNGSFGISWMDHADKFTMCRISKKVLEQEISDELPYPFKIWNAGIVANSKAFWAMLYSLFLPSYTESKKQALYLFGVGNTSKSTFEGILRQAICGTWKDLNTFIPCKSVNSSKACTLNTMKDQDSKTASAFGDAESAQYSIASLWEEATLFHPTSKKYAKLKTELGSISTKMDVKHGAETTVGTNRMHILDSNFPIHGPYFTEDARTRVVEVCLMSLSIVTKMDKREFYLEQLAMDNSECAEEILNLLKGRTPTNEFYMHEYLPLKLLHAIFGYGRKCYNEMRADMAVKAHNFSLLNPCKLERKKASICFLVSGQKEDWIERGHTDNFVDYTTVYTSLFTAGLKPKQGSKVDFTVYHTLLSDALKGKDTAKQRAYQKRLLEVAKECTFYLQSALGVGFETAYFEDNILFNVEMDTELLKISGGSLDIEATKRCCRKWIYAKVQAQLTAVEPKFAGNIKEDETTTHEEDEEELP